MRVKTSFVVWCALGACDGGSPAPATGSATVPVRAAPAIIADATTVVVDATVAADLEPMRPAEVVAFGGRLPALPLLAADGTQVALDVSTGLGESGVRSYEVGIVDKTGKPLEHLSVVDVALAKAILEDGMRPDGQPALAIPRARLAAAAARVTKRLVGFTPFATQVDYEGIAQATNDGVAGKVELGTTALAVTNHEDRDVELQWLGADGKARRTERVPHRKRQYSDREGGRCGGQPRLDGVWWDPPRDRLLLRIDFLGSDTCTDEPTLWIVW